MPDPFSDLYETYKKPIYSYLLRNTGNPYIAEELTHDTFVKAFKSLKRFRGESSLKTWLFTIARNTYISYQKKKSTQLEISNDLIDEQWVDKNDRLGAVERQESISSILSLLSERERSYLLLRDQQGMTYREIAQITGDTEGAVKVGIYRARKRFREKYEREFGGV
ncbi:RNA polymerase sigma factor [Alkalihalobacillus sp. AL-G]|uniref:RNA polymerase sigma factor n=1 Tax=Alkalihalobacillus sp. AL-G TaxID=2926399 RepID=UPI00272B5FD4|nr:RNA polymerase sigma factor [Alkalihalobacillus sp. AL-G]WLD94809.1 RNA polymerase sigma factor [Alkalihalobacillus sp. AL-G]